MGQLQSHQSQMDSMQYEENVYFQASLPATFEVVTCFFHLTLDGCSFAEQIPAKTYLSEE